MRDFSQKSSEYQDNIMIKAIILKFGRNDELFEVLAATREVLVEACPKDVF